MLVEVRVQSLALDRTTNTPVVILQEIAGERVLPIWIGPSEASAIAMQLADMEFSRPLTHDLLCAVLKGLGGDLQKVIITRVESSTYYAEMIVRRNGEVFSLDARPSDSIAVALRVSARIFAQDDLLEEALGEVVLLEDREGAKVARLGEADAMYVGVDHAVPGEFSGGGQAEATVGPGDDDRPGG